MFNICSREECIYNPTTRNQKSCDGPRCNPFLHNCNSPTNSFPLPLLHFFPALTRAHRFRIAALILAKPAAEL
jgi:hypothetical protein